MPRMGRFLELTIQAERLLQRLATACAHIAVVAVLVVAALLMASASGRYLFDTPIGFTEELAGLLFVVIALFPVLLGLLQGRHVRLIILWNLFPVRIKPLLELAGHLISVGVLAVLTAYTLQFAQFSWEFESRSEAMRWLLWPWMGLMPFCFAMWLLALLVRIAYLVAMISLGRTVEYEQRSFLEG